MQSTVTQSQPVVKKVAKGSKRGRRQARQFEPNPVTDMDDIARLAAHDAAIAAQLAQYDDVLFA